MPPRAAVEQPAMTPVEANTRRSVGAGATPASEAPRSPRQGPQSGQRERSLSGAPGPFTREIKVWDPSMLPLGATTHNQDTYKAYKMSPPPSSAAQVAYMPSPHKCEGTTTSAQAYQAWPLERPAPPTAKAQASGSPHKFEGTTHNQEMYRAWKIEPVPAAQQAAYMPSPHKCEGTTTTAQAYQAWPLERGAAAAPRAVASGSACRFEGESESKAAFTAKPLPLSPGTPLAQSGAGLVRSLPFEGQSETSRSYQQPVLLQPTSGMPALGVVTEGGRFHSLLAAGWSPPTRGSATFTTVTVQPP